MHQQDQGTEVLTQAILRYAVERIRMNPPTLDGPKSEQDLRAMVGQTITADGLGGLEALRILTDVLAPACISVDHPRFFSFVPAAPTEAATLFDLVVGASSICGTSWLEAAGAVMAENDALRWLADLAGFPPEAGGGCQWGHRRKPQCFDHSSHCLARSQRSEPNQRLNPHC